MSDSDPFSGRIRIRSCALVTEREKLLMVKQQVPTRPHPLWLAPGGEIIFGESAKDAARRETLEETGLKIGIKRLAAIHEFIEPPYHAIELYFLAWRNGGGLITGTDPELSDEEQQILDCRFVGFEEMGDLKIFPQFLRSKLPEILKTDTNVMHVEGKIEK